MSSISWSENECKCDEVLTFIDLALVVTALGAKANVNQTPWTTLALNSIDVNLEGLH